MQNVNATQNLARAKKSGTKLWKKRVRRFVNNKLAMFGLIVLALYIFAVIAAPLISPWDPMEPNFRAQFQGPS